MSSTVIDLGVNRKPMYDFLLVINCNYSDNVVGLCTSNWSNFGMLSRRAGLSATAGLSCLFLLFSTCHYTINWCDKLTFILHCSLVEYRIPLRTHGRVHERVTVYDAD